MLNVQQGKLGMGVQGQHDLIHGFGPWRVVVSPHQLEGSWSNSSKPCHAMPEKAIVWVQLWHLQCTKKITILGFWVSIEICYVMLSSFVELSTQDSPTAYRFMYLIKAASRSTDRPGCSLGSCIHMHFFGGKSCPPGQRLQALDFPLESYRPLPPWAEASWCDAATCHVQGQNQWQSFIYEPYDGERHFTVQRCSKGAKIVFLLTFQGT